MKGNGKKLWHDKHNVVVGSDDEISKVPRLMDNVMDSFTGKKRKK